MDGLGFDLVGRLRSTTYSGINTSNIHIGDAEAQQTLTAKTVDEIKSDVFTTVTTNTARENSGALANNFDKDKVQSEINLKVDVTKCFDQNHQEAKAEIYKKSMIPKHNMLMYLPKKRIRSCSVNRIKINSLHIAKRLINIKILVWY